MPSTPPPPGPGRALGPAPGNSSNTAPPPAPPFPLVLEGEVVRGFGRGSKDLGIPTANLPEGVAQGAGEAGLHSGIYYGWAMITHHPTILPTPHGMVMSFGWNPYYRNERRTAEVHVLHDFTADGGSGDFYGAPLRVVVAGWIREERDYTSVSALVADIAEDIRQARAMLALPAYQELRNLLSS